MTLRLRHGRRRRRRRIQQSKSPVKPYGMEQCVCEYSEGLPKQERARQTQSRYVCTHLGCVKPRDGTVKLAPRLIGIEEETAGPDIDSRFSRRSQQEIKCRNKRGKLSSSYSSPRLHLCTEAALACSPGVFLGFNVRVKSNLSVIRKRRRRAREKELLPRGRGASVTNNCAAQPTEGEGKEGQSRMHDMERDCFFVPKCHPAATRRSRNSTKHAQQREKNVTFSPAEGFSALAQELQLLRET